MFEFKASFWDEKVYIEGRAYRNNDILTACLNLPVENLQQILENLQLLRREVQLQEDGGWDFCEQYDGNVQRAQDLLHQVSSLAKKVPPYSGLHLGPEWDVQRLFDCLNEHFYWESGIDLLGVELGTYSEDFVNGLGFIYKSESGNYIFYNDHFYPSMEDLDDSLSGLIPQIEECNEAVRQLFDEYITFVKDLIRAQTEYADLLDRYIHTQRRFLTDTETAVCFVRYLRGADERKVVERVRSSGTMKMSHEVCRRDDGQERLCETYNFDSLGSFLYLDFFRGLGRSYLPRRCDNCGRYFLLPAGKYSSYCEWPLKDDPSKTCRDVGARKRYDDKCKNDPIWLAYNRAYKAHYARYMKKKMTTAQFEQWSRYAVELRDKAETGTLEQAEYERLLKI